MEENKSPSYRFLSLPDNLREFIALFKIPLFLASFGIFLLLLALIILLKSTTSSPSDVVFSTESSPGASFVTIRIDIAGAVENPGVYKLTSGNRIEDALAIAGGLSASADRDWIEKNLNKAAKVTDGGKIYIPSFNETKEGKAQIPNSKFQINQGQNLLGVTTGQVNINTASQTELEGLPGVGPVTAGKIISGRPYETIEDLKTKKIVGNALFEKIRDRIGS